MGYREKLREQHALGEEIASAITSAPIGEPIDESELDVELADLEQEQLDDKMLKTGTVPVSDDIQRLPAAANGESKLNYPISKSSLLTKRQSKARHLCMLRRKMRRKSSGSYRLKWLCRDDTCGHCFPLSQDVSQRCMGPASMGVGCFGIPIALIRSPIHVVSRRLGSAVHLANQYRIPLFNRIHKCL